MTQLTQLELLTAEVAAAADDLGRNRVPIDPPLGFGADLDCVTDVTPTWDLIDAGSPRAISQALLRRWTTERGTLAILDDEPEYGLGILGWINQGIGRRALLALGGRMAIEARQDDRVAEAQVTLSTDLRAKLLRVQARIKPIDPSIGEFSLTFALTADGVPVLDEPGVLPFPAVDFGLQATLVVDDFGDEVIEDGGALVVTS